MHDRNGNPLQKGDTVLIEAVITDLSATPDYCNVSVETVDGRRPDGAKERISAVNTGVLSLFKKAAVVVLLIAICGIASSASAGDCCRRPVLLVPVAPDHAYRIVPVTPRGAALAARRQAGPLVFPWLPGDFFRGRGVIVVPAK